MPVNAIYGLLAHSDAESVRAGGALVLPLTLPGKLLRPKCEDSSCLSQRSAPAALSACYPFLISEGVHCQCAGMDLTGPRSLVSAHSQDLYPDVSVGMHRDIDGCTGAARSLAHMEN